MQRFIHTLKSQFIGIIALFITSLFFLYVYIQGNRLDIILATIPIILVLISMNLINKLVKIEGAELRKNQTEIVRLLLRRYPGIQRHNCSERIIIITKGPRSTVFDKEIMVLLEDTNVYLNISMLGLGHLNYFIFSIPNYLRSKIVLRSFHRFVKVNNRR